jgi:hypothetical protein
VKGIGHFGERGVDGMITLKWLLEEYGVDWIHLAENSVHWQAVMKTVMNFGNSRSVEIS